MYKCNKCNEIFNEPLPKEHGILLIKVNNEVKCVICNGKILKTDSDN